MCGRTMAKVTRALPMIMSIAGTRENHDYQKTKREREGDVHLSHHGSYSSSVVYLIGGGVRIPILAMSDTLGAGQPLVPSTSHEVERLIIDNLKACNGHAIDCKHQSQHSHSTVTAVIAQPQHSHSTVTVSHRRESGMPSIASTDQRPMRIGYEERIPRGAWGGKG